MPISLRAARVATFLLGTFVAAAINSPAISADKLVVAEGAHVIGYLPVYIAQNQGYFKDEGLTVEMVPTRGSAQAVAALIGGSADVALATVTDIAKAALQGRDLKLIAAITTQPQMMLTVSKGFAQKHHLSAQSSLDSKLKALKGGTFAISAPGSMTDDVMRTLLTMAGYSPDRDAQIIALGGAGSEMLGALTRKSIDGFVLSPPAGNEAEVDGLGLILVNLMDRHIEKYRDMMFQVVASTPDRIEKKRDLLIRFERGILRAQRLIASDQDKAESLAAKAFPNLKPQVVASALRSCRSSYSTSPKLRLDGVQKVISEGHMPGRLTADQLIDNSLAASLK